ncbi:MAG: PrgI family protein [Oscillospiraceae bacterium]|nr:PrgI family protein [Oscillospiraceae bacterium]
MEVKINKEISNYQESMFFGLSMRQFVFSVLAVAVAVVLYFALNPYLGTETVSWVCVLGAAPFAAMGFFKYHGMTAEQFVINWVRTELIEPKYFRFQSQSFYCQMMKNAAKNKRKEKRSHDQIH